MSNKLYDIAERYRNIIELMESEEFEAIDLQFALNQINDEFEDKADNIAFMLRDLNGTIDVIKSEEQRLAKRRKVLENNVNNIKEYLEQMMRFANKTKFKTALNSFAIQKSKASVIITDENLIPDDFKTYEQVCKVDKTAIYNAMKQGEVIEGIELKENEGLRIR